MPKSQKWLDAMAARRGKGTNQFTKAKESGTSVKVSRETKEKLRQCGLGRKLSPKIRKKISASMKLAQAEGRAWNIGQSRWNSAKSYPEKFFSAVIQNEFNDQNATSEYPFGRFSIDFAWVHLKKAIEIDGKQHEENQAQIERDRAKDALLAESGWQILRISWRDMFSNTKECITRAKQFIDGAEATVDGHPALTRNSVRVQLPPAPPSYIKDLLEKQ